MALNIPSLDIEEKPSASNSKEIGKGVFDKVQKEIEDKDLKDPAVGRLLLAERERLLSEKVVLENYRDRFYEADKRAGILEEKVKGEKGFNILYSFALAIGGILVGAVFSIQNNLPLQIALAIAGGVLLLGSLIIAFFR